MITPRALWWILAGIVLAGSSAGCGGRAAPPSSTSSSSDTGLVRRGQTGDFVALEPGPPNELPRPNIPPQVYLNIELGASGWARSIVPHTPIEVTEDPADEEFWEFQYRKSAETTGGIPENFDRPQFVIGTREQCEALRKKYEQFHRTRPCIGPHYFKRRGPPVLTTGPGGYNTEPLWSSPDPPRR